MSVSGEDKASVRRATVDATSAGHRSLGGSSVERGFTAAFELVATPALFGMIGWFADRRLGTGPILTIALTTFVAGYVLWKLWYQYSTEMDGLQADLIASRSGGNAASAATTADETAPVTGSRGS